MSTTYKDLLKEMIDASYEKVLRDIPPSFEGLTRQQKKKYRYQLKVVRRRAIYDVSLGVAVIVGNGFAASQINVGLGTSAAAGVILLRRGGHAFIGSSSRRP